MNRTVFSLPATSDYKTAAGVAGMTMPLFYWHHSPGALAAGGLAAGLYMGHHSMPFLKARAAYHLNPALTGRLTAPAIGAFQAARERIDSQSVIEGAREQGRRLQQKLKLPALP